MPSRLAEDKREISAIYWDNEEDSCCCVGESDCTRIEAYDDLGIGDAQRWIAVYAGDETQARLPAYMVLISYGLSEEESDE